MSGPKIINVKAMQRRLRRESAAQLRELTAILEICVKLHGDNPEAAAEFRQKTTTVLTGLENLRDREQWAQLLNQTTDYCQLYRDEADTLHQYALKRRAASLRQSYHRSKSTAQLRTELEILPPSSERDEVLNRLIVLEDNGEAWDAVADEIIRWLAKIQQASVQTQAANTLRELTMSYSDSSDSKSVNRLRNPSQGADENRLDRCWTLIAELELDGNHLGTQDWKGKVQTVAETSDLHQRSLLLDSLVLEISSVLRREREKREGELALRRALAEVETSSVPSAEIWRKQIQAALDQSLPPQEARTLVDTVRVWLVGEQTREDVREQRIAVLGGLAKLGYEVREGMTAAWIEQGRVVVHKTSDAQYGVEFSAAATGATLQARVVGAESGRSKERDQEVEEAWCAEFARLRTFLAANGFDTEVVRAHAPGEIPLKTSPVYQGSVRGRGSPQQSFKQRSA